MQDSSGNALKQFHLDTNVNSKRDQQWGINLSKYMVNSVTSPSAYYYVRNQRFKVNRDTAAGKMNMKQFVDLLRMNGKQNYLNLIWDAIMIVNTICNRLVGRWISQPSKINCTAIDMKSQQQRNSMKDDAEFNLNHKNQVQTLEQAGGIPLSDKNQFQPETQEELDLWIQDFMRLPEEILYELGINHVFGANGWDDVLLRRLYNDSAVVGLLATYTYVNKDAEIVVEYLKSENVFYSYSEYDDFRDTSYRGFLKSWKISDIRSNYPKISEKTLFDIAAASKQYQYPDKIRWNDDYNYTFVRPYDDWNVDVMTFFVKTTDTENKLYKVGRDGNLYIDQLQKPPDVLYGKNQFQKPVENIYKGVYVKDSNTLLEWDLQDSMIRPQDPRESGNVEFPISLYMYNNRDMRNVAVPEKIEEPVKMMILTRLKIQQLIAMMTPPGRDYNVRAMRELDLGTGNLFRPLDLQRLKQQTGNGYFTDIDAEGNPIGKIFEDSPNNEGASQLQTLIETYNYHQQVLRDELGINEVTEGQSIKPRVGAQNVQTSIEISFNATDYMKDAVKYVLQDTARKVACLLNADVLYGAKRYRDLLNEEDIEGRDFLVKVEDLPQEEEMTYLNEMLNAAMQSNPQLIMYLDPFKVRRMARENVKLAELYFYQSQKKALNGMAEEAARNSQMNAQTQVQSLQAKGEIDAQLKQTEAQIEIEKAKVTGEAGNKNSVINMVASILSKGLDVPPVYAPFVNAVLQNVMLPLVIENETTKQQVLMAMQQAQQPQLPPQEGQEPQEGQMPPQQEQQQVA